MRRNESTPFKPGQGGENGVVRDSSPVRDPFDRLPNVIRVMCQAAEDFKLTKAILSRQV